MNIEKIKKYFWLSYIVITALYFFIPTGVIILIGSGILILDQKRLLVDLKTQVAKLIISLMLIPAIINIGFIIFIYLAITT